ncbi:hypothetical protein L207DRAFT_263700 [Hyaloscypha variabilis F]|uniref:Uncharacterized protein n=1 Tax=Hyaloscypha variabilis (strain UAMH 11265 / GT02V1 / F) TaxID=1149755 RepID=A0A2J6QRV5_HYAVF|nr:hypothetical protein L207DRAFT_263700 [Hyaloscypha variabilis F]
MQMFRLNTRSRFGAEEDVELEGSAGTAGTDGGDNSAPGVPRHVTIWRKLLLGFLVSGIVFCSVALFAQGTILIMMAAKKLPTTTGHHFAESMVLSNASLPDSNISSLSNPCLRESIMHGLNSTIADLHASRLNTTSLASPRGLPPTVPNCWIQGSPKGPVCRLTVTTWDSPGYNTAILGAFDPECNLIGYLDNAPIGQWVDFNSELPQVLVTFVEGINSVYFKYAGTTYGNKYSEVIT